MFEKASRLKLRFDVPVGSVYKGTLKVEDLWDVSVETLDSMFKAINTQLQSSATESLLQTRSKADDVLDRRRARNLPPKWFFLAVDEHLAGKLVDVILPVHIVVGQEAKKDQHCHEGEEQGGS